jgi:hypothetical protein
MADPKAENALREALSTIEDLEARWDAARNYLKIDASRTRHMELSTEAENPDLWNDQGRAREVTTELGRLSNDLEAFDELRGALDDSVVLVDFTTRRTCNNGWVTRVKDCRSRNAKSL